MKLFKKVAIVGTGLIGGSIALSIKKKGLAENIVGVSRHKKSLLLAKRMRAIDAGSQQLDIIKGADLLILSTPVNTIIKSAPVISELIGKDCIVTDVGSTKNEIVTKLNRVFPNYVGSHPMAGSEKSGISNARPDIFKNSLCILTPVAGTNKKALNKLSLFWRQLGTRVILLSPGAHDRILAFVSHLPHLVAFSLIDIMPRGYLRFASGGLKDTTRVAASSEELWADIFLSNRKNILTVLKSLENELSRIRSAIYEQDSKRLSKILKKARDKRKGLDKSQ